MNGSSEDAPQISEDGDSSGRAPQNAAPLAQAAHVENDEQVPEENKFQKAISAWRNIDLTGRIPNLDKVASDLVAHQRDSLVERKDLAQRTKDFRKLDDAAKLNEVKVLLKGYQTYIDLVTNQTKTVSNAFLQVYSSISEAPDPYPLLEASIESLVVADETMPKLEEENRLLQNSNAKLTAQLEATERRLEEERSARILAEEEGETRIKEIQNSWSAVLVEKQDNWEARERSLEERAESQERLMKELKASYEVNQRLDRDESVENVQGGATAAELDMVSADLERATMRLAEIEARNEQLRLQLAQSATQHGFSKSTNSVEDDPAFLRLRSENSSLLRRIDASRIDRESEKREWDTATRSMRKDIAGLKESGAALRVKLNNWSDYPDVKRELEILKSIEFSTGDDDFTGNEDQAVGGAQSDAAAAGGHDAARNLEQLLLARNKKLNNELTILRVSHQDLASKLEALQSRLSNTSSELERYRNLNKSLEDDLAKVQDDTMSFHGGMSVAGTYKSRHQSTTYGSSRRGRMSPTASIISGIEPYGSNTLSLEAMRAGEPVGGGSGILPMITAQRDRFKKRISELDAELAKSYQTVSALRSEVAALQKDNLNLYEKSRFVTTFNRGNPTTAASANAYSTNPNPSTIHIEDTPASPLYRYKSAYEHNISPFAVFRGKESARALKRMSLPERAMLQVTKVVLANRTSRVVFAAYFFGLHLVIILMMMYGGSPADAGHYMSSLPATAAAALPAVGPLGHDPNLKPE